MPDHPIGTDAVLVMAAIDRAWSDDGVLVLMDLGSAVLSAEMAIDLMPEERRSGVLLCEAPIVEGAVAAAVTAKLGAPLERVAQEARGGLAGKIAHLGDTGPESSPSRRRPPADESSITLTVNNPHGLHARPAARFVQTASSFDARVTVRDLTNGRGPADASSLNAVAMLGATQGHDDRGRRLGAAGIRGAGGDRGARRARLRRSSRALRTGACRSGVASSRTDPGIVRGYPASAGIAIGPARRFRTPDLADPRRSRRHRGRVGRARRRARHGRRRHRPPARARRRDERTATRRRSSTPICSSCGTARSCSRPGVRSPTMASRPREPGTT